MGREMQRVSLLRPGPAVLGGVVVGGVVGTSFYSYFSADSPPKPASTRASVFTSIPPVPKPEEPEDDPKSSISLLERARNLMHGLVGAKIDSGMDSEVRSEWLAKKIEGLGAKIDEHCRKLDAQNGEKTNDLTPISTRDSGNPGDSENSEPKLECNGAEIDVMEELVGDEEAWERIGCGVEWKIATSLSKGRLLIPGYKFKTYKRNGRVDGVVVGSLNGVEVIIFVVKPDNLKFEHECRKAINQAQAFARGWKELASMNREELVARKDTREWKDYDNLCVSEHKHRQIMLAFGATVDFPTTAAAHFDNLIDKIEYPHLLVTSTPAEKAFGRYSVLQA